MSQNRTRKLTHDFGATTLASVGLLAITTVFAVFFAMAGTSTVTAATFNFQGGIQDNYVLPTDHHAQRRSADLHGRQPICSFDYNSTNRRFLETFENCPTCIVDAHLTIGMKPLDSGSSNDTIRFLFTDSSGSAVSPTGLAKSVIARSCRTLRTVIRAASFSRLIWGICQRERAAAPRICVLQ